MNLLRAEDYLRNYRPRNLRLSDAYDDDEMLRMALEELFPGFEYPDISHLTIGELHKRYCASPQPIPTP